MEWSYNTGQHHADPFNEIELDVVLTHENGQSWRVPGFWAGGSEWRARFAPPLAGNYKGVARCSRGQDANLEGQTLELQAAPYTGSNPLLVHGPIRPAASGHHLEYGDGTPFFWLGDTWWMGFCKRLSWPTDFQTLAADRVKKGFNVVQIVAGLYPDMPGFDPRGANEAGFPWEPEYARINPAYFDMADLRIAWLARLGLTACIVGCWGYYLPLLGVEKMKQHWRNIVARWSAYPVVWCLAGEALMPYYLSEHKQQDEVTQKDGWTELGRYVHAIDPYQRLVTIHPTSVGRDQVEDESLIDLNMLQTGHDGYFSVPNSVKKIQEQHQRQPAKPVLVAEANYEGIVHLSEAETQRLTFWTTVLSGGCGYTYGANGLWQLNTRQQPYGPSPHGASWGNTPWDEAYQLPGSAQLALARKLLERYPWQQFEAHPEWTEPSGTAGTPNLPFAAGIPGKVRMIYFFSPFWAGQANPLRVCKLEKGKVYHAFFWDPRSGLEYDLGQVSGDAQGEWFPPFTPEQKDWVLVLE
jgi:hypothetical protein